MSKAIRKSFKREIALAGLLYWLGVSSYMFWGASIERLAALHDPYFAMSYTVWAYAAAAFGLHAIATQWGQK